MARPISPTDQVPGARRCEMSWGGCGVACAAPSFPWRGGAGQEEKIGQPTRGTRVLETARSLGTETTTSGQELSIEPEGQPQGRAKPR
eukprot:9394440-Pyramimonas_sp.AAC.1